MYEIIVCRWHNNTSCILYLIQYKELVPHSFNSFRTTLHEYVPYRSVRWCCAAVHTQAQNLWGNLCTVQTISSRNFLQLSSRFQCCSTPIFTPLSFFISHATVLLRAEYLFLLEILYKYSWVNKIWLNKREVEAHKLFKNCPKFRTIKKF